jgi:hypothetical protein
VFAAWLQCSTCVCDDGKIIQMCDQDGQHCSKFVKSCVAAPDGSLLEQASPGVLWQTTVATANTVVPLVGPGADVATVFHRATTANGYLLRRPTRPAIRARTAAGCRAACTGASCSTRPRSGGPSCSATT